MLIGEFESEGPTDGFMSVTIALLFFFTVYVLEMVGNGIWFRPGARGFIGDYAYPVYSMLARTAGWLAESVNRSRQSSGPALLTFLVN